MKEYRSNFWQINEIQSEGTLTELLSGRFSLPDTVETRPESVDLLDDFDWHIWNSGQILVKQGARYTLQKSGRTQLDFEQPGAPVFCRDFDNPAARERLTPLLGFRALQTVFHFEYQETLWPVRNLEDDKLVCHIRECWVEAEGDMTIRGGYLVVTPMRGYGSEFKEISRKLQEHLLLAPQTKKIHLRSLLKQHAIESLVSQPIKASINYDMPSENAVRVMLKALLEDSQRHIDGICTDIDSEYLHDFRVQIRKARSLVQLMRKSLQPDAQLQLKQRLADIARPTGALRDLDVFLLEQQSNRDLLPETQQAGFDLLLRNIRSARVQALKKVRTYLKTGRYENDFAEAMALVEVNPCCEAPEATRAVGEQVGSLIAKRYRKICKMGLAIDDSTPDEMVHNLRIECKKLRYLLTLFGSLYAKSPVKKVIKRMKGLQTVLGDFNDYAVQQIFLNEQASRSRSQPLIMAVSGLVAVLNQKQRQVRGHVCEGIADFSAPETAGLIKQLVSSESV